MQADVLITIMAREKAVSLHEYKINKSDKKKELKLRERDGSQSNVYEKLNNESENNSNAKPIKSIKILLKINIHIISLLKLLLPKTMFLM